MLDHPTPEDLKLFVRGALSPAEMRALVAHLIAGACRRCAAAFAADAPLLREPAGEPLTEDRTEDYDAALRRAFAAVRRHGAQALEHKSKVTRALEVLQRRGRLTGARGRYSRLQRSEALLRYACELRHDDPLRMHDILTVLVGNSERLLAEGHSPEEVADFTARAQAELANACRINHVLLYAERELHNAFKSWRLGTRDPFIAARLHDVQASLLGDQYRYREAVEVLEDLAELYLDLGDRHLAGRALIKQGIYLGYGGDSAQALALIEEGLELIDQVREPGLMAIALHNRIYLLTDQGCYSQAFALLTTHRRQLLAAGGERGRAKLLDVEAWILSGLGHLDLAESLLHDARAVSAEAGAAPHAALVTLNLSLVVLRQGRTAEARSLAEEAWRAFTALDIAVEAQRAVVLVRDAFAAEIATVALVQSAVDFLRRLEREPAARFRPDLDATS